VQAVEKQPRRKQRQPRVDVDGSRAHANTMATA
jgi:hypothetical protein